MPDLVRDLRHTVASRAGRLAGAAVGLVVVAVFAEAIFSPRVFYERDIHAYWYPFRAVITQAMAERSLPLWNPYVGFGAPLLSDPSLQLAYPLTWLALLLPAAIHYKLFAIGHTLLAAAGAWALARRLGLGRTAAMVAGSSYALSGPLLSSVNLFHHHVGAAWIPWVLWALEGLLRGPGVRAALTLGLMVAGQILTGSGDMCLASALLGTARIASRLLRPSTSPAAQLRALARYGALAALLAAALSAVQWLPTAELVGRSGRAQMDLRTASYWSLHPVSLVDLAVPRLVADLPLSTASRAAVFEGRGALLACIYVGVVPLALGLLALLLRSRPAAGTALGVLALVLLSLGRHAPLYWLFWKLPGFGLLRYPQKLLIPAALCVALLAAFGAEAWGRPWSQAERRRGRWAALALVGCALVLAALAAWVASPPGWLAARLDAPGPALAETTRILTLKLLRASLLMGLVALLSMGRAQRERGSRPAALALLLLGATDCVLVGRGINRLAPAALLEHRPAAVARAERETRICASSEPECLRPGRDPAGWEPAWIMALGVQDTLRPPSGARWGLFGSYDGEFTGLGSSYSGLLAWNNWIRRGTKDGLRLLQIANVGRVFHVGRSVPAGLVLLETLPSPFDCPLLVLRVPDPVPRAYVVRSERPAVGPQATLAALLAFEFDPARDVVLDVPPVSVAAPAPAADDVQLVARTTNTLELRVRLPAPGTLVVVEAYDPNWRAEVDARPATVLRANGLFRAVRLASGEHRIRFEYRPWSLPVGALLSSAGLVAALALAWATRAKRSAVVAECLER
jgi:hypothetical protein